MRDQVWRQMDADVWDRVTERVYQPAITEVADLMWVETRLLRRMIIDEIWEQADEKRL